MVFSSSPALQGSGFFKQFATPKSKPKKEVYYEDLYGSPNEDEVFDRYPDKCESEPSSDGDDGNQFSKSGDYKRFFSSSYAGSNVGASKTAEPSASTLGGLRTPTIEKKYKIFPKENSRRSMKLPSSRQHGMNEEARFGDAEDLFVTDSSPSAAVSHRRSEKSTRMARPPSRRLFKQQLAEQDREKQKANAERKKEEKREIVEMGRKEKVAVRQAKASKEPAKSKNISHKKAKLTKDLGGDEAISESGKGYVLIDLAEIDVDEYERFSD